MNDTSREFERMVANRYAGMTPEKRVHIAAGMFDTARQLVLASFPAGLASDEVRQRLCRRFYGALADKAFSQTAAPKTPPPGTCSRDALIRRA